MAKISLTYFEIDKDIKEYHNLSDDVDKMVSEFVEVWNGLENKGVRIVDIGEIIERGKVVKFEAFIKKI